MVCDGVGEDANIPWNHVSEYAIKALSSRVRYSGRDLSSILVDILRIGMNTET